MKLARYIGNGQIEIVEEPIPACPAGGLLIRTEACGLCSGELMDWYMDQKIPHVLGHEVAGRVVESDAARFPVGSRVFAHHHAPCLRCESCQSGRHVHCEQWKRTKLSPGGMAEFFAVSADNLTDTLRTDDIRPQDAALIEPLACVVKGLHSGGIDTAGGGDIPVSRVNVKSLRIGGVASPPHGGDILVSGANPKRVAVIGLGSLGLMHMLLLGGGVGYDLNPDRLEYARSLGMSTKETNGDERAEIVFVCPGNKPALDFAIDLVQPGGTIVLFAPMPPGAETPVNLNGLYFQEVRLVSSYSCGPEDTQAAAGFIRSMGSSSSTMGLAEKVVSDFIEIDALPDAYRRMKRGEILKAMVMFE